MTRTPNPPGPDAGIAGASGGPPAAGPVVLVVEDDPGIAETLAQALAEAGYGVRRAPDAAAARALVAEEPDAVVLDLMLPDGDGLVLCGELRRRTAAPILVASATGRRRDAVLALRLGADAFMAKPLDLAAFVARVGELLRRASAPGTATAPRRIGGLLLDGRGGALLDGAEVGFTPSQYRLVWALAGARDRPVPRPELAGAVWGDADGRDAGLGVLAHGVRARLGRRRDLSLVSVRGAGLMLASAPPRRG